MLEAELQIVRFDLAFGDANEARRVAALLQDRASSAGFGRIASKAGEIAQRTSDIDMLAALPSVWA